MIDSIANGVAEVTRSQFASAAELLAYAEEKGLAIAAPVPVLEIATKILKLEVDESPDLCKMSTVGSITLEGGVAKIWINPFENSYIPRKRFTLAHEIAHYCLHLSETKRSFIDDNVTMNRSDSYWNSHEFEANNFAAELLMPKELVTKEGGAILDEYKEENSFGTMPIDIFVDRLAKNLKVSNKAMEFRLTNLGVIKPRK